MTGLGGVVQRQKFKGRVMILQVNFKIVQTPNFCWADQEARRHMLKMIYFQAL